MSILTDKLVHESEFKALVARLLKQMGATVLQEIQVGRHPGYDLRIRSSDGLSEALVEIKLYRTLTIAHAIIGQSFNQLELLMQKRGVARGLLITNARVAERIRTEGSERNIVVYDFDRIVRLIEFVPASARSGND